MDHLHKSISTLINKYDETLCDRSDGEHKLSSVQASFDELLKHNLTGALSILNTNFESVEDLKYVNTLCGSYTVQNSESIRWKYVCFSLHVLLSIEKSKDDLKNIFSVSQSKNIRILIEILVSIAILPNLIPGVGIKLDVRSKNARNLYKEDLSKIDSYVRLRTCTLGFLRCNEHPELRKIIVSRHLIDLFAALCQLSFTPLKKPQQTDAPSSSSSFQMTDKLYCCLSSDQSMFKNEFESLLYSCYQPMVVKTLMMLIGVGNPPAPTFLKRVVAKYLCDLLMKKRGLISLVRAMFPSNYVDMGAQWNELEVLVKLIMDIGKQNVVPNYFDQVCAQTLEMINTAKAKNKLDLFIVLPRMIIKILSDQYSEIFKEKILMELVSPLERCTKIDDYKDEIVLKEDAVEICVEKLYFIFIVEINSNTSVSAHHILPYTQIIFQLYINLLNTDFTELKDKMRNMLIKLIRTFDRNKMYDLFDSILFNKHVTDILTFCDHLDIIKTETGIVIKCETDVKLKNSLFTENIVCLSEVISNVDIETEMTFFKYLLETIIKMQTSDNGNLSKNDLLRFENEATVSSLYQIRLACLESLAKLSEKKYLIKKLQNDANSLLSFIKNLIDVNSSKNTNTFEESEYLFVILMLLDIIIDNVSKNIGLKNEITEILTKLKNMTKYSSNEELKLKIAEISDAIENGGSKFSDKTGEVIPSEVDKALIDICDPLLPVRAHGMMTLTKLIEKKDPVAYARKQFLLCIFQENLKHEDSYIYLTAINGIASLANAHPDTVVSVLTEEFINPKQREGDEKQQIRINFGEILVRVTKCLGEMAPKYKSTLLNAFLCGTRDEDHLVRASSLSNLAEACQILGYKLGNIITEILCCIHAIVKTDKSIEVRRAAVLVIRQLFKGLGNETLIFLKDDILIIYRTLKFIYCNDTDDVMKLHAQLALEELDSITRDFLLPQTNLEKKISIFNIK